MSVTNPNKSPVSGVLDSVSDLFGDLLDIFELQIRLGREDAKIAFRSSAIPAMTLIIALSMIIAALPVMGFAVAKLVQEQFKISEWLSHFVVGASMIAIALLLMVVAFHMLKIALRVFKRSTSELSNNIRWLKSVVRRDLTDDADSHRDHAS